MARRWFPADLAYRLTGTRFDGAQAGSPVAVCTSEAMTTAADILHEDLTAVSGSAPLLTNIYAERPGVWGPPDGTDALWASIAGGPPRKIEADKDARIDDLDERLAAIEPGGGAAALQAGENLGDLADAAAARTNLGLGNVNNTADTAKPISTATQSALDAKAALAATITTVAAPTGVASTDTAAIQAALDAAYAAGGGLVQLRPRQIYGVSAGASASLGGVRVRDGVTFDGNGSTLRVAAGTNADITGIVRTPSGEVTTNVTVRNLKIDGNAAGLTGSPTIVGVYTGVTPNATDTDLDITFENVEVFGCTGYGFDPHERTTRLRLVNCTAHDNGSGGSYDGFTLDACYSSVFTGCISYDNTRHGFNFVTAAADNVLTGCEAYGNGGNGLTLQQGAKRNTIVGNRVYGNTGYGIVVNGTAQVGQQDNTPGGDNVIVGNLIESNTSGPTSLVSTAGNRLAHNGTEDEHPAAGLYTSDTPTIHGLTEWNYDPLLTGSGTGQVVTAGVGYGMRVVLNSAGPFSNVILVCGTLGGTLGATYVAVYDAVGARLAVSADVSGSFTSTGVKTLALGSTISGSTPGASVFVLFLCASGSPTPALVRGGATGVTAPNIGLGSSFSNPYRFFAYSSGLSAAPTSLTAATMSSSGASTFWCGVS